MNRTQYMQVEATPPATSRNNPTNYPTELTTRQKKFKLASGEFTYEVPPPHGALDDDALFIAHIDAYGVWL